MKTTTKKPVWTREWALDGTMHLLRNGRPYKSISPNGRVDYWKK